MSLFDRMVHSAFEKSPIALKMASLIEKIAIELTNLRSDLNLIADTQRAHNTAIIELYTRQRVILSALKSSGTEMKLPDLDKDSKTPKPN